MLGAITICLATANDFGYALLAGGLRSTLTEARSRLVSRISGLLADGRRRLAGAEPSRLTTGFPGAKMIEPGLLVTYVVACFVFSIIPGPSVTVVLADALSRGTRAGLWTILGTELSMLSMILVVAFGLDAVMAVIGEAFVWIKLVGAAYLVYLGWRMLHASGELETAEATRQRSPLNYIVQAALVNWSNPKTLLFLGAFLPQFVDLGRPALPQILVLGLVLMAVATSTDAFYAILAGRARQALSAARVRLMNRVAGAVLVVGGVWLALMKRA